jgi:hypothetical protein
MRGITRSSFQGAASELEGEFFLPGRERIMILRHNLSPVGEEAILLRRKNELVNMAV